MLTKELMSFIQEGVSIMAGTCDDKLLARGTRVYGMYANEEGTELTLYLNALAFVNLRHNFETVKEIALGIARPSDYRSIQIKGKYLSQRAIDQRDKMIIDRYVILFADQVASVGAERSHFLKLPCYPAIAITMKVESVFNQTPHSGTGQELK